MTVNDLSSVAFVVVIVFSAVMGAVAGMNRVMIGQRNAMSVELAELRKENRELRVELNTLRNIVYRREGIPIPNE